MTDYRTFPDAEAVAAAVLRPVLPVPVSTQLAVDAEPPVVTLTRIGGTPTMSLRMAQDVADIQVDVWGSTKAEAHDLAQLARVALHRAANTRVTYESTTASINGVDDAVGIAWLPDPTTYRPRYTFAVRLFLH